MKRTTAIAVTKAALEVITAGGVLPFGFEGFDVPDEPIAVTPRMEVEKKLGSMGSMMESKPFLRSDVGIDRLWFFKRQQSFYIEIKGDESKAKKMGKRFQKALRSAMHMPSSYPELRDKALYVGHDDGYVELPPLKKYLRGR